MKLQGRDKYHKQVLLRIFRDCYISNNRIRKVESFLLKTFFTNVNRA